jgi:hypothetical protein
MVWAVIIAAFTSPFCGMERRTQRFLKVEDRAETRWRLSLIVGRQHNIFTAFTCIRSGNAHVHHPALMVIIYERNERARGKLDGHRRVLHVEDTDGIRGIRIPSEGDPVRSALGEWKRLVVRNPGLTIAVEETFERNGGIPEVIGNDGALIIQIIACALRSILGRIAAFKKLLYSTTWWPIAIMEA